MDVIGPRRPISRETRLLLITVLLSLATLWVLARIRFADRPAPGNPIEPMLTQLAPLPVFDQLSSAMFQVQTRLAPFLFGIDVQTESGSGDRHVRTAAALRLDSQTAVAVIDGSPIADQTDLGPGVSVVARDPASGLTVLDVLNSGGPNEPGGSLAMWVPRQPQSPRYLVAGEVIAGLVSGRPVLVGPLEVMTSEVWSEGVWALPTGTDLKPGTFVFSTDGAFAGLVASVADRLTLVPGDTVKRTAERLRQEGRREFGTLGIEVQPLTPRLALGARAQVGVIVTAVDPQGPAAGQLRVTDVIVGVGGEPLSGYEHWHATATRAVAGQTVDLLVQRDEQARRVTLTAVPGSAVNRPRQLGLTLRSVQRTGAEVLGVAPGSMAAEAGIQPGDLITVFGGIQSPTPNELRERFASAPEDRPLLVAVTRGAAHHVLTIRTR